MTNPYEPPSDDSGETLHGLPFWALWAMLSGVLIAAAYLFLWPPSTGNAILDTTLRGVVVFGSVMAARSAIRTGKRKMKH